MRSVQDATQAKLTRASTTTVNTATVLLVGLML